MVNHIHSTLIKDSSEKTINNALTCIDAICEALSRLCHDCQLIVVLLLRYKLLQVWPDRDYRRAIFFNNYMLTPTMTKFVQWRQETTKPIIADGLAETTQELSNVRGL